MVYTAFMHEPNIKKIDLNLLLVFDAIHSEGSLTRAGERLGMTQSAVSHALARLREATGDQLFERTRRGVKPTLRASEMSDGIRQALDLMRMSLSRLRDFDLPTETRTFLLDVPAGIDAILAPELARRLDKAPRLSFHIAANRAATVPNELRLGESYIALDYEEVKAKGYCSELLYSDNFVVLARRGHPALRNSLTMEKYEELGHVAVGWGRGARSSPLSQHIQANGIQRTVKVAVPTLTTMLDIVEHSDLLGATWSRVGRGFAKERDIEVHPLPFKLAPLSIFMVWHTIFDADPGHVWLRGELKEIFQSV